MYSLEAHKFLGRTMTNIYFDTIWSRIYISFSIFTIWWRGLGGLVVSALDFQAGYRGFESRSGRDNFQTISTPSSHSTCSGLNIKWTGRRLVTDSGTKCTWVIHESKAVQIHVHSNRRCLYVSRVPGSVKNSHNNNHLVISLVCEMKNSWLFKQIKTCLSKKKKKKNKCW